MSSSQVPLYIAAQLLGSILASGTLYLLFDVDTQSFFGTVPTGSHVRSLVIEIIISFLLMFVVSGVATDNRSVSDFDSRELFSFSLHKRDGTTGKLWKRKGKTFGSA